MTEHHDDGFTMPELLIVIVLMGLIASVIGATFSVLARDAASQNDPETADRIDDARSLNALSIWLPQDVDSTRPDGFTVFSSTDASDAACAGTQSGPNLLTLEWAARGNSYLVNYRHDDTGNGPRIYRHSCVNGGTPATTSLSGRLPAWSTTAPPIIVSLITDGGGREIGASMLVTTVAGATLRFDGTTNNPNETLPPTTVAATTTSSVANQAPVAFDIFVTVVSGDSPFAVTLPAIDPDSGPSALAYSSSSGDPDVTIDDGATADLQVTISATGADRSVDITYTVVDGAAAADGVIHLTVVGTGTPSTSTTSTSTTSTTTTTIACSGTIVDVDPATVSNGGAHDVAKLNRDVTVTIATSGSCLSLALEYEPNLLDGVPNPVLVPMTGTTHVIQGKPGGALWSDGSHTIRLLNGVTELDTATLVVSP